MKKLLLILCAVSLFSCSVSDDGINTHLEILPIESAVVPDEFVLNNMYQIDLTYLRPSTCHAYKDIYYVASANERTIAIVTTVFDSNSNCEEISDELEASFTFKPTELGTYIFKFWQGTDTAGLDEYMVFEVPVFE